MSAPGQIKSVLGNFCVILFGAPIAAIVFEWMIGEVRGFQDIPKASEHAIFGGTMIAFGWLVMASPFGVKLTGLVTQFRSVARDGSTVETSKMVISETPILEKEKKHESLDPSSQSKP